MAGPPVIFDTLTAAYPSYEGPVLNVTAGVTGASETTFLDEFGRADASLPLESEIRIQVRDASITHSDAASVIVRSLSAGDSETVTLLRAHAGSDLFEGRVFLSAGTVTSGNRILESWAGDTIEAEHADANGLTSSMATARAASLELQMLDADGKPTEVLLEQGTVRVRLFDRTDSSSQGDVTLFAELMGDYTALSMGNSIDGVSEGFAQLVDGTLAVAPTRLIPPTQSDIVRAGIFCDSLSLCPPVRARVTGGLVTFRNALGHPVEAYAPGEPVSVRLEKHTGNSPGTVDVTEATVQALPNGSTLPVTLTETGAATNVFTGSILTADADGPPTSGKLRMRIGETVAVSWENSAGVFAASDTARVQAATIELLDEDGNPLETLLAGRTVTIRSFYPAENTNPSFPDALPAEVLTLRGDLGQLDRELVGLSETGPDTGLFVGTVETRFGFPLQSDGTIEIVSSAFYGAGLLDPVVFEASVADARSRAETRSSETRFVNVLGNDAENFELGALARLEVEFHDFGNPESPDQIQAWILSEATDDFETVTLTETGADTKIFAGSIPSTQTASVSGDGTFQAGAGTVWAAHFSPNTNHLYSSDRATAAINQPPVAVNDEITFDEDSVPSVTLDLLANDFDPEGQPLQVTAISSAPPSLGTFTLNPDGSITYVPTPNQYYSVQIEYTLSDGVSSVTGQALFIINPIPDGPVAVPDTVTIWEGGSIQISVLDNDQVGDELGLSVGAVTHGAHGTAANLGNTWVVYATTDPDYSGTDTFTYTLEGGGGLTAIGTVTVIIEPLDDGFIANDDTASTPEDSPVTINVLSNDIEVDSPKSVTAVTQGAHGTAVINPDFSITYTPAAGYSGTDTFTYTGLGSPNDDQGLVTVTIAPVNDAPDAVNDTATTAEDTAATILVLANDTDPEGNTLTVTAVTQGAHGSVTFTAGSVAFIPAADYSGSDSFTYTISDGNGGDDTATVNVTITAANDAPDAVNDSATTPEDTAATITALSNDTDPENDSLSVTAVTQGAHGTVTFTASSVTFTPAANYNGTDSFTYTVSDGNGGTDTATVNVTITSVNDGPSAVADSASTAEDTAVSPSVLANDSDPEDNPLIITGVTQGAKGSVTFTAASVTYAPAANANGADSFTYTVADGQGGTATGTVSISISPVNDAPDAVSDAASTLEDTAVTVPVLANDLDADGESLQVTAVTQGARGTVTVNANGTVTYAPSLNTNGPDSFTYTVRDAAGLTDTATVNLTVAPVNDPPVAVADAATTRENAAVNIPVLPNDSDADGNTLSVTTVSAPASGTAAGNPDSSITYTPSSNFNGTDTFTYTVSDGQGGTATATVTVTVKDALERVAVLGTNSVHFLTGSDVLSGDVVVNQAGTGPFLNGGVELSLAGTVTTPAGYDVEGNRINLASGAVVNGDAFYNTRTGTGSVNGNQSSPLILPIFPTLPVFESATPGTTNVTVANNGTRTLAAGSYLDLVVGRKGVVTFTGGTYHFRAIQIDREAKLIFNDASQVRVQQKLSTGILTTIGPAADASFDASSLIFYIGGANGTTGTLAATPKAVEFGSDNILNTNIYAPNGTLWLKDRTQATGALIAKDVQVGANAQVSLDSFYVGQ